MTFNNKYRPSKLSDIVGNTDILEEIKQKVEKNEVDHMIFTGPAGVGKTTTSIAIAKELYGEMGQNISKLILNKDIKIISLYLKYVKYDKSFYAEDSKVKSVFE